MARKNFSGTVVRLSSSTIVVLANGFRIDFFVIGLTDDEYIKRANEIYRIENTSQP